MIFKLIAKLIRLPMIKKCVLKSLAKRILIQLELTQPVPATDSAI